MTIRKFIPADRYAVKELLVQLQSHLVSIDDEGVQILLDRYREEYFSRLLNVISSHNGKIFVAVEDKHIVGVIAGIIEPKDEVDNLTTRCPVRGKVLELVVSTNHRSSGIGTALLKKLEQYFISQNCEFICADVFAPNSGALCFYESNAYTPRNIELYKRA